MDQLFEVHSVKAVKSRPNMEISRFLFVAVAVFIVMFLYRGFVLPHFPGLNSPFIRPLVAGVAGAIGGAVYWISARGESSQ